MSGVVMAGDSVVMGDCGEVDGNWGIISWLMHVVILVVNCGWRR